jgi:hypothetical protein
MLFQERHEVGTQCFIAAGDVKVDPGLDSQRATVQGTAD